MLNEKENNIFIWIFLYYVEIFPYHILKVFYELLSRLLDGGHDKILY